MTATATCLRWRTGRSAFRAAGEVIRTEPYDVAAIALDRTAKDFVEAHHYSQSYPAARFRYGLYNHGDLAGVAVFSHPCNDAVLSNVFPAPVTDGVELGRFVLLDDVPGNGETWFLARCFELLRSDGIRGVVSFSDPVPRSTVGGETVFPGHLGTIYQAHNANYRGRGTARTLRLLPDGRVLSDRAISKLRAGAKGWRYTARLLEASGADPIGCAADAVGWLAKWLPRLTRTMRHPGNFKYAWGLDRWMRRQLPASLEYPKRRCA